MNSTFTSEAENLGVAIVRKNLVKTFLSRQDQATSGGPLSTNTEENEAQGEVVGHWVTGTVGQYVVEVENRR